MINQINGVQTQWICVNVLKNPLTFLSLTVIVLYSKIYIKLVKQCILRTTSLKLYRVTITVKVLRIIVPIVLE